MGKKETIGSNESISATLNSIMAAAQVYKTKMVGYVFLYVFEGHTLEVVYRIRDFMHMTGVESNVSAEQFFKNAVKGSLKPDQVKFSNRHPYALSKKKVSQLENISLITNSDIFMLEDMQTKTFTYKFGITDLNFTVCLGQNTDKNGNAISKYFSVRSIRVEDSVSRADEAYEVQYIFSRKNDEKKYNTIMYADKRMNINDLTEDVLEMLDDSILASPETDDY
ncbi:MAG: PBECR4 domain-containing protein [Clostridiales bacterium]|nr:PBECR4 domain-containing protein [Clostridiales bacterium]